MSVPIMPVLLTSRRARLALRRAVPRGRARLVHCRTAGAVARALASSLADA